jgi:hypothetical protein
MHDHQFNRSIYDYEPFMPRRSPSYMPRRTDSLGDADIMERTFESGIDNRY